ncbi:MAG TPA: endopeptidase La [Chloroflexia bacterium]|nr:endopeptidase La [Chloroflexia bacterium]
MSDIEKASSVINEDSDEEAAVQTPTETEAENKVSIYPFIPLKNVVVFPRVPIKLVIGSRSQVALEEAQANYKGRIVVAAQRERDQIPEGSSYINELYAVGTLVEVTTVQRQTENNGSTEISVEGICRVRIDSFRPTTNHPNRVQMVEVHELEERGSVSTPQTESLMRHVVELYGQLASLSTRINSDSVEQAGAIKKPGLLADYVAAHLPKVAADKVVPDKQAILEELDQAERLERVSVMLAGEIELLEMDSRIRNKVRQSIDKNQREFYLREQLKAIHDELGGEMGNEIAEFRKKLEERGLPEEIKDKMLKEVSRLERMSSSSPESNVVRTYLDWVLAMPWQERTTDNLDVSNAAQVLNADHFGLEKVKDRILEFMAVRQLVAMTDKKVRSPILCLAGPPGVGKTSLGQSIARSMGRKFVRISLGGVRDESEIRGHRRTYVGALPGRIVAALKQAGTRNPVILLDEVDKMSSDFRGDPAAALLEVLDPEQNHNFVDHYLDLPFDLSEVFFITTANYLYNIPRPLLDRMEIIDIDGYTEEEKLQIAKRYLLPKQIEAHALKPDFLQVSEQMLRNIIRQYTREAGVRNLERKMATICRKAARQMVEGKTKRIRLSSAMLEDYLGVARFVEDEHPRVPQVGVAMGLAYTEYGGAILPVEVAAMPGRGSMIVTGRLGEVMQESSKAAMSYARSRSKELGIDIEGLDKIDLHIHLPEGAVPKDGPSAGITMATALISVLSSRRVRSDTAMTGEITLRGRVLAIGGLKEKALSAHRAGIKRIIAPMENKRDLRELPKIVQKEVEWIWVETMDEVVREIFVAEDEPKALTQMAASAEGAAEVTTPAKPSQKPEIIQPATSNVPAADITPQPATAGRKNRSSKSKN